MKLRFSAYPSFAALALLAAPSASGEVTNLVSTTDTALFGQSPDNNLGGMEFMPVGTTGTGQPARGLIGFNLAGVLPSGAVVTNATLTLTASLAQGEGKSYSLHRMLVPWNEGGGSGGGGSLGSLGAAALNSEVTWNRRAHPATTWGAAGGLAGTDFASTGSATGTMTFAVLMFSSAQMADDVNAWLTTPATNFGWLIKIVNETTTRTANRIGTHEDAVNAPILTVDYSLPPSPAAPDIFNLQRIGNQIRFSFNGQAGRAYSIDGRTNLTAAWTLQASFATLPADTTLHFTNAISGDAKYYQVRTP